MAKKVLVYDAEPQIQLLIKTILDRVGYDVIAPIAPDERGILPNISNEVGKEFAEGSVDLVTTCLKGHGGSTVITLAKGFRVPILIVSGWSKYEIPPEVDGYIEKPVSGIELIAEVERLIGKPNDETESGITF